MNIMKKPRDIWAYAVVAAICLGLWLGIDRLPEDCLRFLLFPHAKAVELFYATPLAYVPGLGYAQLSGGFVITKECMGGNFIIMLFAMNACMFMHHFQGAKKAVWAFCCLLFAVLSGVLLSCLRILGTAPFVASARFDIVHVGNGAALYLLAAIMSYFLCKKLMERKDAKVAEAD